MERCAGCGGVFKDPKTGLGVIERVHRCSGVLLEPPPPSRKLAKASTKAVAKVHVVTVPVETAVEPLHLSVKVTETVGGDVSRIRAIDQAVAACPVCAVRRARERKKKKNQRIRKTIPGQTARKGK